MKSWLAILIRNIHIAYWFVMRPTTRGAKVGIFYRDKILLVRLTYYPNAWTFPGGAVNKKETPKEALIRECKEEVGVELTNVQLMGDLYFDQHYKKDTVFVFKAVATDPKIVIDNWEVAEAGWFNLDNLPPMGKNSKAMLDLFLGASSQK